VSEAPANSPIPLSVTGLNKRYGATTVLQDLQLRVEPGAVHGLVGLNGSGKTTTIRTILHIFHADSGEVEVLGERSTRAANDRIGYLPEERGLYKSMKVGEQAMYLAQLRGLSAAD